MTAEQEDKTVSELIERIKQLETALDGLKENMAGYLASKKQFTEDGKLMKNKICPICKGTFTANREDALYCSAKCRQVAYRERKNKEA